MKNYKIGDEVLVKCKIVDTFENGRYKVTNSSILNLGTGFERHIYPTKQEVYPTSILQDTTAEEAWDIAKKFNSLSGDALIEIFDTDDIPYILQNLTIWKIKEKIEEWESNQFKVGDVVIPLEGNYREGERGLIICFSTTGKVGVNLPGNDFVWFEKNSLKKDCSPH